MIQYNLVHELRIHFVQHLFNLADMTCEDPRSGDSRPRRWVPQRQGTSFAGALRTAWAARSKNTSAVLLASG